MSVLDKCTVDSHESYGSLVVTRSQCGHHRLFGSSIRHDHVITLSLHQAEMGRMLSNDWLHPRKKLFEVEMSQNQWAQLVSSVGIGEGTPCTITWHDGPVEKTPDVPTKQEQFDEEFKTSVEDALKSINDSIAEVNVLLGKKSVSKTDLHSVARTLEHIQTALHSNLPFIEKQFTEQMEKTVTEAKAEVEGYVLNTMERLSLMALKENAPELEAPIVGLEEGER